MAAPPQASAFGDRAGEHLRITRGRYSAWPHVVIGFLMVAALSGLVLVFSSGLLVESSWLRPWLPDRKQRDSLAKWIITAGIGFGFAFAFAVFRNRWRCVEAYASRYCMGIANLSLAYVPLIAAGYALVRGARKLTGREREAAKVAPLVQEPAIGPVEAMFGLIQRPEFSRLSVRARVIVILVGAVLGLALAVVWLLRSRS